MRELLTSTQFKRDMKKARKRGKDRDKLERIIAKIVAGEPLDQRHRPHRLSGDWSPCWECHIEPDWLLIWDEDEETVMLVRTGTHSDLFD
ncbi:MAG: type II toxin-antitoxin system YafQ family toxin [Magnetospirillum sp. WYHS-4]